MGTGLISVAWAALVVYRDFSEAGAGLVGCSGGELALDRSRLNLILQSSTVR